MFSILLPDSYKTKKFTELLPLLIGLENHDWAVMSYGLSVGRDDKEPTPMAAGIPTTCGSIVFWRMNFHGDKLLAFARERIPREKFVELKEKLDSEEIGSAELRDELGEKLANSIALEHPDSLDYLEYELLVTVPAAPRSDQPKDADVTMIVEKEVKKLRAILEIYRSSEIVPIKGRKPKRTSGIFNDAELHAWGIKYSDITEVLATVQEAATPESLIEEWNELSGDAEEEQEEPSYVLLLRAEVDAQTTPKELESQIDAELKPLEGTFDSEPAFITLAA